MKAFRVIKELRKRWGKAKGNKFYKCKFVETQEGICTADHVSTIRIEHCKFSPEQKELGKHVQVV